MAIACNGHCVDGVTMPPRWTATLSLSLDRAAPQRARGHADAVLRGWGVVDEDVLSATAVVLSELVTNALLHCGEGCPAAATVALHADRVRVSVTDPSPAVPRPRTAANDEEDGRGLTIVAVLASRWGVQPLPAGKLVFAELPLSRAVPA